MPAFPRHSPQAAALILLLAATACSGDGVATNPSFFVGGPTPLPEIGQVCPINTSASYQITVGGTPTGVVSIPSGACAKVAVKKLRVRVQFVGVTQQAGPVLDSIVLTEINSGVISSNKLPNVATVTDSVTGKHGFLLTYYNH